MDAVTIAEFEARMREATQNPTVTMVEMLENILVSIFGAHVWDDSPGETARRVLRFWEEYSNGEGPDFKLTTFPATADQLIVVKDIEFSSICAHHLLPFYGRAHVGYVPHELQIGLSKIPRVVKHFATRPQVQENLTREVASFLKQTTHAKGVAVIVEARHTCMACRGIRSHNAAMVTSEMRGIFLTAPAARQEFLALINVGGGTNG